MNKWTLSILILFSLLAPSMDAANDLHIGVRSEQGKPLDNVWVVFAESVLITGDDGVLSIEKQQLRDKDAVVNFYRTGYQTKEMTVGELLSREKIILASKAIEIEGIRVLHEREDLGDRTVIKINQETMGQSLADVINLYGNIEGLNLTGERRTLSLGGHEARHLTVMVDGIVINRRGQPVDISGISLANIESVEIIPGGGSAAAGSGAISGIINVRTRSAANDREYLLRQEIGSFGMNKSSLSLARVIGPVWLDLYVQQSQARNDFRYEDRRGRTARREYNDKQSRNLYLKLVHRNVKSKISYKIDYHRFNDKLPGPVNYSQLYQDARMSGYGLNNNLTFIRPVNNITFRSLLHLSLDRVHYDNTRAPHPFFRIESRHYDMKRGAKMEILYDNDTFFDGSFSAEYNREDFEYREPTKPANSIEPIYQENSAFSLDTGLTIPIQSSRNPHSLPAGDWNQRVQFRYDITRLWDSHYSWRYVTSYGFIYPQLTTGLSLSRNYSLPSFYDLYWKGDSQVSGNIDLQPELSFNMRLFSRFEFSGLMISGSLQRSKIDDLIYWYRSVTGWKPGNIAAVRIDEYEITAEYQFGSLLNLSAAYSLIDAINKTKTDEGEKSDLYGKKIPYRPEQRFNSSAGLAITERLMLKVNHSYTGEQHSTLDQLIDPIPSYHTTGIEAICDMNIRNTALSLSLKLDNIFDNQYEIYRYTPQPGFNWRLGLSIGNIR